MRFSAFILRQIRVGSRRAEEGFVREVGAEAEAGDEVVEAVGVEKVGGEREVLLEVRSLFLSKRLSQFRLKVALFLHQLFHAAVRTDGAVAG